MITTSLGAPSLRLARMALPLLAGGVVIWFGAQSLADLDPALIWQAFATIHWAQWAMAALCIWISFAAIGRYDETWHRILGTKTPPRLARQTGMAAVAVGQTVGFGAVTGGLVRWQCLPAVPVSQTAKVSAAGAASFLTAWAIYAAVALIHLDIIAMDWIALITAGVIVTAYLGRRFLPDPAEMARLFIFTGTDLCFAAAALYLLMPSGVDVPFSVMLAGFILALGMGLITNIPAGAGVLEVTLLGLLAPTDAAPIFAGLCAFRIVGYLGPALIAMIWLIGQKLRPTPTTTNGPGEWDLLSQHGALQQGGGRTWFIGYPLGLKVALGGPAGLPPRGTLGAYKINPQSAAHLRGKGWQVGRIASEAVIDPATWAPQGRPYARLRHMMKKAQTAGVTVTQTDTPPIAQMTQIATQWAKANKGERGFSTGRYEPSYIAAQKVFLIHQGTNLIGFITFQEHGDQWSLDLMRSGDVQVDGAMHLAVATAITQAASLGIARVSLAAVSDCHLTFGCAITAKTNGLLQFKQSFRPAWIPLYHAAPNRLLFAITLGAVTWAIKRPIARSWQSFALKFTTRYETPHPYPAE